MKVVDYIAFKSKRRFGVEIEVNRVVSRSILAEAVNDALMSSGLTPNCRTSSWGYCCNNSDWIVKTDSSCGDSGNKKDGGGYEIASSVGKGYKHLLLIEDVTRSLKKCGAKTNDYCGLHCQVEIKDFTYSQASCLLAYWCKLEKLFSHTVPNRRNNSIHCRPFTSLYIWRDAKSITNAKDFWYTMRLKNLNAEAKRNTITLVNYQRTHSDSFTWNNFNRPTVELRFPESSLNGYDVKNWARLFVHFVESCSERKFPGNLESVDLDEFLFILGLKGNSSCPTILSPGLYETKLWLLTRLLQFSSSKRIKKKAYDEIQKMSYEGYQKNKKLAKIVDVDVETLLAV